MKRAPFAVAFLALAAPWLIRCGSSPPLEPSPLPTRTADAGPSRTVFYYGGPVIPNARVYVVWWGSPSLLDPSVTSPDSGAVPFFEGVTNSRFLDWLSEYDTAIPTQEGSAKHDAGTGQHIGRGNYGGVFTLTGVPTSGTVTDARIRAALVQALAAGSLPPADGDAVYAIFFPRSVIINDGAGAVSCQSFGGYHGNAPQPGGRHNAYYLVLPDCGGGTDGVVTSHELVEAITDPIPTPGSNPDFPQAWNDHAGDEVGDLCESSHGFVSTALGSFHVQGIWSEVAQDCVTFRSNAQDFNVSFPASAAEVGRGAPTTVQLETATVNGDPQTLALSVAAPDGVEVALDAASVLSGQPATLTVKAGESARERDLQVTVTAAAPDGRAHTAALLLSVDGGVSGDAGH